MNEAGRPQGIASVRIEINPDLKFQEQYYEFAKQIVRLTVLVDILREAIIDRKMVGRFLYSPYARWRAASRLLGAQRASDWLDDFREETTADVLQFSSAFNVTMSHRGSSRLLVWIARNAPDLFSQMSADYQRLQNDAPANPGTTVISFGPQKPVTQSVEERPKDKVQRSLDSRAWSEQNTQWVRRIVPVLLVATTLFVTMGANGGNIAPIVVTGVAVGIVIFLWVTHKSSASQPLPLGTYALKEWKNARPSLVETRGLAVYNVGEMAEIYANATETNDNRVLGILDRRLNHMVREIHAANFDTTRGVLLVGVSEMNQLVDLMNRRNIDLGFGGISPVRVYCSPDTQVNVSALYHEYKQQFRTVRIFALLSKNWIFDGELSSEDLSNLIVEMMEWDNGESLNVSMRVQSALLSRRAA
jgi:hypothetical protein